MTILRAPTHIHTTTMHIIVFLVLGGAISASFSKLIGARAFQVLMLQWSIVENCVYIAKCAAEFEPGTDFVRAESHSCRGDPGAWWSNMQASVLLAGGDVDVVSMALLPWIWFVFVCVLVGRGALASTYMRVPGYINDWKLPMWLFLIILLLHNTATTVSGILVFYSMFDPVSNTYHNRLPLGVMVAGAILTAGQGVAWAYYTYRAVTETPVSTIEGIYQAFAVDVIHWHHFMVVFVLGWWMFPIICSIAEHQVTKPTWSPRSRRIVTYLARGLVTLLMVANLAAAQFALWCIFRTTEDASTAFKVGLSVYVFCLPQHLGAHRTASPRGRSSSSRPRSILRAVACSWTRQ